MTNSNEQSQGQTKKCPKCQEDIQLSAKRCKHCSADLRNWFIRHKIITGILILFALGIIGSAIGGENNNQTNSNTVSTNENSSKTEENVTQELTEEEKIRALVQDVLKGKNNLGTQYVKKIDVIEQVDGGWGVFVEFNADDNLTTNLRKGSIESKMAEIYIALYTNSYNIRSASASAYFPLTDKYGNESSDVVYKSILNKTEADKVNWNANDASLKVSILPSVWTTSILHYEFQ